MSKPFAVCLFGAMLRVLFGAFAEVLAIYMMDKPAAPLLADEGVMDARWEGMRSENVEATVCENAAILKRTRRGAII